VRSAFPEMLDLKARALLKHRKPLLIAILRSASATLGHWQRQQ
jgi:hypothetical protein